MLAALAGVAFAIAAVFQIVGRDNTAVIIALVASAIFAFHFVLGYYVTNYRR